MFSAVMTSRIDFLELTIFFSRGAGVFPWEGIVLLSASKLCSGELHLGAPLRSVYHLLSLKN